MQSWESTAPSPSPPSLSKSCSSLRSMLSTRLRTPTLLLLRTRRTSAAPMISSPGIRISWVSWSSPSSSTSSWYDSQRVPCKLVMNHFSSWTAPTDFQPSFSPSLQAANFLEFKDLLDLGCKTVANMIKGKSVEGTCCKSQKETGNFLVFPRSLPLLTGLLTFPVCSCSLFVTPHRTSCHLPSQERVYS